MLEGTELPQSPASMAQLAAHPELACAASKGGYTVALHIVAIFALLIASLLGTMLPLIGKYISCLSLHPFVVVIGKCISSGVVMAVAMVHMMHNGVLGFMKDCVSPSLRESFDAFSLAFAMLAAMLMHALDVLMDFMLESWEKGNTSGTTSQLEGAEMPDVDAVPSGQELSGAGCHNHGALAAARLNSAKSVVAAIFMEFGLASHSVFLGLSVGIAHDAETRALLVALVFHQIFEGLALGSRLADASMNFKLELLMTIIYAVSVPLGTVVGVVVVTTSNISLTGTTFVTVQAVIDSVCGGILLYLGFTLLLNDFRADLREFAGGAAAQRGWKRFGMLLALWGGATVMTLLGKWA
ncbi:solute carrier family 39 (zinc transporter), member 1/2/3 [Trypanosoma conorhini]|uniref:Solute carrier family 39 (Zinc transporter), member 1/2/3 n=1 Tax=Trypanosoma conorhini TaxID=83891 RepID=A0A3R7K203_9TRYP|nr:solute carrier family 39 (zinc transporter), member 1/2/3 [Trypanosoma conorhini]RNE99160.1 solute carrier family 39 (zinc transporter), member 1/2/3 [Trypanosoma conorhini]